MTNSPVKQPFPFFTDANGAPLENGKIYIGQPGYEARTNAKASYFDVAGTIPTGTASGAAITTRGGYASNNGAAATVYVDNDYSLTVTTSAGVLVFSTLSAAAVVDDGGLLAEVEALIANFSATLTNIDARLDEYQIVAADYIQPSRRLMPTGDSYIMAADDDRRTLHLCISPGTYRIDCSNLQFGCQYSLSVASAELQIVFIESGPGMVFVGGSTGRFGLNNTCIELQSGETVTLTKGRSNEIYILSSLDNPDYHVQIVTGPPSVETIFQQDSPNGEFYTVIHTRTLNANQVLATTTPTHPTRTFNYVDAVPGGACVIKGVAGAQMPFAINFLGAGPSFGLENFNATSTRCTVIFRNVRWTTT